jgi:diacylglycerol kinase (ATP)
MIGKIAIILNGVSRNKRKFYQSVYPALTANFKCEVFETQYPGHAGLLATAACDKGFDIILAAGGDGTLNQVVNGVLNAGGHPTVGAIPMGTGNDFANRCGLKPDADSLLALLRANSPTRIDIGKCTSVLGSGQSVVRYFINECSIGLGPAVVKRLEQSNRKWGASLTYTWAITTTFFKHRPQEVECTTAYWKWKGKVRVLAIANGRTFGHGIYLAPESKLDDGLFNTFIAGAVPLFKFLGLQVALKSSTPVKDKWITYNIADWIELTSSELCPLETEGELAGQLPARIELLPKRLAFLK